MILASAFIPIFTGWLPPRYRGIRVIDGGYSDNVPILDTNTITVSPFCGNSDICPQDDYILTILQIQVAGTSIEMSKDNLIRLSRVLMPPDPEVLSRYCKQGFEDTLRFLQRRYLISCTRCLAVDSTYEIGNSIFTVANLSWVGIQDSVLTNIYFEPNWILNIISLSKIYRIK